jgi:toxin-antitoxin system PIN domain toxin
MKIKDPVLFDTNILVFAFNEDSPKHGPSLALVQGVLNGEIKGYISMQNLCELYAVITHPKKVPHPVDTRTARESVAALLGSPFIKISPTKRIYEKAFEIAGQAGMKKNQIYDAVLAATMLENGISAIFTDNTGDFKDIAGIKCLDPFKSSAAGE